VQPAMSMFRRMFGGPQGANGAGVSASSTGRTVDAIQKLGEVRHGRITVQRLLDIQVRMPCPLASNMHVRAHGVGLMAQTEELLVKRRNLLEKKIEQETERAKEFTRTKNKRGARSCSVLWPAPVVLIYM